MSAEATNWVWKHSEASGSDRLVLLALADFCNEKAECYASYAVLAKKTKLGIKTIYRSFRSLMASGELQQISQGDFGAGSRDANEWKLPKIHNGQNDNMVNLTTVNGQTDQSTIHNNTNTIRTSPSAQSPNPPQLTVVKESNSLPSGKAEKTSQPKREDVLGKGLTDDEWMGRLSLQHPHIDIPLLFDRCVIWCRERGKVASRRQFMAFVRNAKAERPIVINKPQPAGQSAWDRELAEIRKAVGE
jgi:hypothetical protein